MLAQAQRRLTENRSGMADAFPAPAWVEGAPAVTPASLPAPTPIIPAPAAARFRPTVEPP